MAELELKMGEIEAEISEGLPSLDRVREVLADEPALRALACELIEALADLQAYRAIVESLPAPPPVGSGWVSLKAAADYSGYSVEAIRLWAARREINAVRSGGRWLVRLASVARRAHRFPH